MAEFSLAVIPLLAHEGEGFVPEDRGRGPSKWGVTLRTAREFHPDWTEKDIESLTARAAGDFYLSAFWNRYHIGLIQDQAVADKVLDLSVNIGGGVASRILQEAVGAKQDGIIGRDTARRVNSLDPQDVIAAVRAIAEKHYRDVVASNPGCSRFLEGWLTRLNT